MFKTRGVYIECQDPYILTESNFFRVMENPIPGHIIEMWRVKVRIFSYFSRFVQNNGVPYTRHIRSN